MSVHCRIHFFQICTAFNEPAWPREDTLGPKRKQKQPLTGLGNRKGEKRDWRKGEAQVPILSGSPAGERDARGALPAGWTEYVTKDGRPYGQPPEYYSMMTKKCPGGKQCIFSLLAVLVLELRTTSRSCQFLKPFFDF